MRIKQRWIAAAMVCMGAGSALGQERVLDDMSSPERWKVVTADGVRLEVRTEPGAVGECLRLDYEFVTGAGFCIIQRELPMALPANYEFAFRVRGEGPANNLEFKLLDQSGESVWWVNRRAFEWPREWTRLANKTRKFEFAWGPSGGAPLTRTSKIEFAIASNQGGKGTVWLDELGFREAPAEVAAPARITASSQESERFAMAHAMDGDRATAWRSLLNRRAQTLKIDRSVAQGLGGVVIEWEPGHHPEAIDVEVSRDGQSWERVLKGRVGPSPRMLIATPGAEARMVRMTLAPGAAGVGVREIELKDEEYWEAPNEIIRESAAGARRGVYPRSFLGEQSYWTVVGAPGAAREGLINEEGAIEVDKRAFTIEPFVMQGGRLRTWGDAEHAQSLDLGYLPIPTVTRRYNDLELTVTTFVEGEGDSGTLYAIYTVRNTAQQAFDGELVLAVRPFQVNPPWQRLNFEGGVAAIRSVGVYRASTGARPWTVMRLNGDTLEVGFTDEADRTGAAAFDGGDVVELLENGETSFSPEASDANGLASAFVAYTLGLAPGASRTVAVVSAAQGSGPAELAIREDRVAAVIAKRAEVSKQWSERVSRVGLTLPASDAWIADTFRSQLAYILINRDGPAFQPGSRSYERSWARDGSMTSAALLECGFTDEVREWIEWYGAHQFDSGKVPCVVDRRGPDPVPEHDSHGQFIWAVSNYYRYTGDREFLIRQWPRVKAAAAYIESLRAQRTTGEFEVEGSEKQRFYGLVPESISHEGYSAKPMHSYWDNFFCVLGLKEAERIATTLGATEDAEQYVFMLAQYQSALNASILRTMKAKGIDYIPGCAELGDFDSTSTTIALFPCDEQDTVNPAALNATFERYWRFFEERRDTGKWEAYTPYEIRHVGAFVRLEQPQRAYGLLRWFRGHRRPPGWNHWAEVVWNDPLTPKFIGDMPHTWVGSDFLNSVRAMFVYERGDSLVVFGGVPREWVESGEEVSFRGFVTPYGTLDGEMKRDGAVVRVKLSGEMRVPSGAIVVTRPPGAVEEDAVVRELPAEVSWKMPEMHPTRSVGPPRTGRHE